MSYQIPQLSNSNSLSHHSVAPLYLPTECFPYLINVIRLNSPTLPYLIDSFTTPPRIDTLNIQISSQSVSRKNPSRTIHGAEALAVRFFYRVCLESNTICFVPSFFLVPACSNLLSWMEGTLSFTTLATWVYCALRERQNRCFREPLVSVCITARNGENYQKTLRD